MNIYDKARELGQAIVDSPEYNALKEAEAAQEADETAMALLEEYNEFNKSLADEVRVNQPDGERMAQIRDLLQKKYDELMENSVINAYVTARSAFENVVNQVNAIIGFFVKGEETAEGGCSGNCGGCSGCH